MNKTIQQENVHSDENDTCLLGKTAVHILRFDELLLKIDLRQQYK